MPVTFKIYKYTVLLTQKVYPLRMPRGARILSAELQGDTISVWALFDKDREEHLFTRMIAVIYTGQPFELQGPRYRFEFINTVIDQFQIVRHLFEVIDLTQQDNDGALLTDAVEEEDNFEF